MIRHYIRPNSKQLTFDFQPLKMSNSEYLKFVRLICIYFGYWPVALIKNDRFRFLYRIYHHFFYVYTCFFTCCAFAELYRILYKKDYSEISKNISYTMVFVECVMKMNVSRSNMFRNVTQNLTELENKSLRDATNPKQIQLYHNLVGYLNTMIRVLLVLGNVTVLVLVVAPRFQKEDYTVHDGNVTVKGKHSHVFSAWIPLDGDKHYSVIYIMHVVAGYCAFFGHFGNDFIVLAFMIFCIQQFRMLRDKIYRFRETALMIIDGGDIELDAAIMLEIGRCIRKHQTLIR